MGCVAGDVIGNLPKPWLSRCLKVISRAVRHCLFTFVGCHYLFTFASLS